MLHFRSNGPVALVRFHNHPYAQQLSATCRNIVACYGIGKYEDDDPQHPGSLFIVQELVHGGNMLHKVGAQQCFIFLGVLGILGGC